VTIVNLLRERGANENEALLPAGREQARMLAGRVGELGIERIWTSPLHRAREVAEIVAQACDLPLEVASGLREIDVREKVAGAPDSETGPDETFEAALERVGSTLEQLRRGNGAFLGVTHMGTIRAARILLCGGPREGFEDFTVEHCQLIRFQQNGELWEVHAE
jgi:broad specificity phosphatase PhoE